MGFHLQQKSMTLNDLERQSIAYCDQTAKVRIRLRAFHYKFALHLSCPHIRFADEIKKESLRISSIISD